jgi:hypothetical protein
MSQSARSISALLIVGTVLWAASGVIALAANAESKTIWTCISGVVLGLIGIRYTLKRARKTGL